MVLLAADAIEMYRRDGVLNTVLKLNNITKLYPGVVALDGVTLSFEKGEIHSIVGENGAGKSTLINIIGGVIRPDNGIVEIGKETLEFLTPSMAKEFKIAIIHQELNLIPSMTAAENIFLGNFIGGKWTVDFKEINQRCKEILERFDIDFDPGTKVEDLSNAQQQIVEIAKAISSDVEILIMDEPSAMLALAEVRRMQEVMRQLKKEGVTIIYVSHRLDEIFEVSDRVTVMRDGQYVTTREISDVTRGDLVNLMVGRVLEEKYPGRNAKLGETVLECRNLTGNGDVDISFSLRQGEILGLGGLIGSGRTELVKMLFGAAKIQSGELYVYGKRVHFRTPHDAIAAGIGLVPEDRKTEGLFLNNEIRWNISIMSIKKMCKHGYIDRKKEAELSERYCGQLRIKAPTDKQAAGNLSGGNQQKVVLAKTIAANTNILIFDEPTKGIDVGAKQEMYKLMSQLAEQGAAIIMISSDMEELLGMSDRLLVLCEGRLAGELLNDEYSQVKVLELASTLNESGSCIS